MRVTDTGIYLQQLVMVHSYTRYLFNMQDVFHMVYSLLVFVNIRVIYLKHYFGKYNTSVHRQEYSTKYYCWYCQLKRQQLT